MNSSWMPDFFFPFLLFIRSNQWNKKKKKAREGSRSSHDEIFPAGHPFSFQLPLWQSSITTLLTSCVTSYKNLLRSRDMFFGSAFQFGFLSCQVYIYITFRLQNMNNFILRFQFLFRLFTTYLNEIQTKSVIIRLKLCANGHRTPSNVESCCVRLHVAKRFTCFKLCATTPNNTTQQRATSCNKVYLEGVQTDATCNIQRY